MVNKVRTIDFLPEIFRTHTNRQVLNASLDVLVDQPNLRRVEGFIGEKYGYGVEPNDKYVVEPTKARRDYQLDPGVIFLKEDTQIAKDFINYPGLISALKHEGANVSNHQRLFENEFYSWDPFVDYDKIVNYTQYYWIPNGPDAVPITTNTVYETGDYTVTQDDNGYKFNEVPGTNPEITVLRGGTYEFNVQSGFSPFWIQTVPGVNATASQRTISGVSNNGTDNGTISFTVPPIGTLPNSVLYYQSGNDELSVGKIKLIETNTSNYIDIDDILGKKSYVSPNGIVFTNGLKVKFEGNVIPSDYSAGEYYVEGVGSSIVLLPVGNFIASEQSGEAIYDLWDITPWDIDTWDAQLYVPVTPDYLTISRNSRDYNAWSRSNRWFHQDVINTTTEVLGYVTILRANTPSRAQRPIIEYRGNLKLYNSGIVSLGPVNVVDTTTTDAFTEVEGKTLVQVPSLDGYPIGPGVRIVFSSDTNPIVRQNVYLVNLVDSSIPGVQVISLVPDTSVSVINGSQVFVYSVEGVSQSGITWWFSTDTLTWTSGQRKTQINQYPLYDIFDNDDHSLSDNQFYSGTTFNGTKLFSYTEGTGPNDPVLGFPIAYSTPDTIGDILFTVNLNYDTFTYNKTVESETISNINIGYVHYYPTLTTIENLSGWVSAAGPSFQYQVFEYPIIENLTYSQNNTSIIIDQGGSGYLIGDKLKILGSSLGGTTPENDLFFTVQAVSGSTLTAVSNTSISGTSIDVNQIFNNVDVIAVTGVGSSAIASVVISGPGTTSYVCDVLAKTTPMETPWNSIVVYYNDNLLDDSQFVAVRDGVNNTTTITVDSVIGSKVTVLIISEDVSKTAYYQTPSNLENNPFNTNITSVAVGDMRNQYRTIFTNAPGITGTLFGNNNVHDSGNLNKYGTAIIQNSASLVLPGLFLRKQEVNLFNALQFNSEQYQIYKTLLIDLAATTDYSVYTSASDMLDDIIYRISSTRTSTNAFFWSDMLFSGNPYVSNSYTFGVDATTADFSLSTDVWSSTLYSTANYNGIGVYLTTTVGSTSVVKQLIKNIDYVISTTAPSLTVNYSISSGDVITIKQYNQTYGSYCPNTPSKLGLYPIYIPEIIYDGVYSILGHDGSKNKLYGNYNPSTGALDDFRDKVLLEFETRVYNNYKVVGPIPITGDDIFPGQFRTTEYTRTEILNMYSTNFLNWVGANRIDYKTQTYIQNNKFSYNYNESSYAFNNQQIIQGFWKGIYNWLYDTTNPSAAPWEMLGLITKPDWWDTHYGAAPYTSGNTYMWQDIANGYVWNDGNPYINEKRIRPYLLEILPVDTYGNLLPPFISVMGNYNSISFNRDWVVGDQGPVESAYLSSSSWPFDLMRILVLAKPAKFFNLFVDRDRYKFNSEILTPGQYLYDERYHLDPRAVQVYGDGTAKHSYINWCVDYVNQKGSNGTQVITSLLRNIDVRLTYNVAGFTAKNYLKFLVEKATPNSRNTSLLIPDENYSVLLYDNPPEETIIYSSVIIQKVSNGWTVWGNSKNKNYFTTLVPKPGYFKTIGAGNTTVKIAVAQYEDRYATVPYGTVFYSIQAVSQFLQSYGAYLSKQGVVFEDIVEGVPSDWGRMIQEFLLWSQQGWQLGSIISVNPNARKFVVNREGLVPQPLTIQEENFLLNQNLLPIQNQDLCIDRLNEYLEVKILSPSDTVAYANLNLNSIEHAIIFDNSTSFNDTIYNLQTGLRQPRLLMQGYKTGDWNGFINANGFIINENNVQEWVPNKKYPKNFIVTYKNRYYTARTLIEPKVEFSLEDWLETDYGQIKEGLLPNPSTTAYEAQFYYDTTRANLENDADLLSFSLIGFRPRDYLTSADLSDITQINVYKNIVKSKGTTLLAESFRGAQFDQGRIDYSIQENWAIKTGDFGAILNNNFVEARLDQSLLAGNPTVIGFNQSGVPIPGVQQVIAIDDIINYERPPLSPNFLPKLNKSYSIERGIPSAGYVNLGDSKFQEYTFEELNDDSTNITKVFRNDCIWIANYKNSWDIFTAISLNNTLLLASNNLNGSVDLTFDSAHGLSVGDLIAVVNFDYRINGFYTVRSVVTLDTITIELTLDPTVPSIQNSGVGFKLITRRFEQAADAASTVLPNTEWSNRKTWIDYDLNNQWAVYGTSPVYRETTTIQNPDLFGVSVAHNETVGTISIDGAGVVYRYYGDSNIETVTGGYGSTSQVKVEDEYVYISSPNEDLVYVYVLINDSLVLLQTINPSIYTSEVTGAIAVGGGGKWLYIANSVDQEIVLYAFNYSTLQYDYVDTIIDSAVPINSGWGTSIATSVDGVKLVVGAPNEDLPPLTDAGAVYVYSRRVQRFYANGSTSIFTLTDTPPNNIGDVYVNDVLITSNVTIIGTTVTVLIPDPDNPMTLIPPLPGSIVTVDTGYTEFVQRFESDSPHIGALFGNSVDTNRYGAEVVVGVPYELVVQPNNTGVEGIVYRYTNDGQRYGVVTGTFTGTVAGTIFVDGYVVSYSGTISDVVNNINTLTPTNIVASYSGNTFVITVKDDTPEVVYNIIDVTGNSANLAALGITPYTKTQIIRNHNNLSATSFGYSVKMSERDSLLVGAITDIRKNPTTFDYVPDCLENDTVFDNDATIFIDNLGEQGVVYMYDYLPAYNESIDNPGQYAFGQYISTQYIASGVPAPKFGYSLAYNNGHVVVGAPNWSTTGGGISVFSTTWTPLYDCEILKSTSWYVDKLPLPIVDIDSVSNISLYNIVNNSTLDYLDYIDPLQGKLLGAVRTNIDYLEAVDPAVYTQQGVMWTWDHVGNTWLDLRTIRLLNYHQPDVAYNAKNWGKAFPGSTADIYTWIESNVTPLNYVGDGIPANFDKYTSVTSMDNSTNNLVTKYYFWVKNYNTIPTGKTLTPLVLSTYILNPLNSGISFMAPITTNIVALYNSSSNIQTDTSVLHIGYGVTGTLDSKHTDWNLIRVDDSESFLPGLPTIIGNQPTSLYLKFIQSFSGFDSSNNPVPDPRLPELVKYGTLFRPRQSMFINRLLALNNYITYANNVLIKLPIVEIKDISYLQSFGLTYDTRNYWEYTNWWANGYSNDTKPVIEVENVNDLQTIIEDQLLVGISGALLLLEKGLIAKVKQNSYGNSEYYVYNGSGSQVESWTRIGAENSTIQISPELYSSNYGWSAESWGGTWDKNPAQEITWVIRWLNEQCYIGDLEIERNKSLILMFNYIQSESQEDNNYLPWLSKTSLIDVNHRIRSLLPYKKYQRDNQEFLEGFLNEIKPYHVLIKEFIFSYDGLDTYYGNITDFDLPATYNTETGNFQTPQLVYGTPTEDDQYGVNDIIWDNVNYKQWFNNRGLSISTDNNVTLPITFLTVPLLSGVLSAQVNNVYGLPTVGSIKIDNEIINYNSIDYATNTINGLTRGIDGTLDSTHVVDSEISIIVPEIIVYNRGRGYLEPPRITAYIDTSIYPSPRVEAVLEPIMAGQELIGINVVNGGEGYAVTPEIVIDGSTISSNFVDTSINIATNQITVTGHPFINGDSVIYTIDTGGTPPAGLVDGNYYYVRSIDPNTIALYESYEDSTIQLTSPYLHLATDDGRVDLKNSGTGTSNLTITARARCFTSDLPVREFKVKVKFDRITYTFPNNGWDDTNYDIISWDESLGFSDGGAARRIEQYYEPTLSMPGKVLSQLMTGVEYPNDIFVGADFSEGATPTLDTILVSPSFTDTTPTTYNENGGEFLDGYTPEELVGGYVSDVVIITITSNDLIPSWNHKIEIDKYGNMSVRNNSGAFLDAQYLNRWWYGPIGSDPSTDPLAATTMSTNTGIPATFLRS